MSRKSKNSSAATPDVETRPQEEVAAIVSAAASDPSGENGPDGANTVSESGDAAREASAEQVKPQDAARSTPAAPADATKDATDPDAEASASGTNSTAEPQDGDASTTEAADPTSAPAAAGHSSTDTPESDREDGAGNMASPAGLTAEQVQEIRSRILGIPTTERRRFLVVFGPVRHNNVRYPSGARIDLTETEHAELRQKKIVASWESGMPLPEVDG